ncbi:MAG TPA: tRNA (adenosine(37)-N6)-threonylcarbamoyltransferase complex ATPase subunit type 1 TsaE [Phycisphaerales bacterium]|nr:tRNA (adenosine(37)-N6)-threonylcarbamoyltransferase complex ATPase subunit type 1 TsaE [Phycisphaerales bacterium]HMP37771.1 tRNA (adenosine(37)-N6)-threonylcarbamoyltransferase complex ATPase subunit type 1 TsaE [Phycisphaerales bacterium]
MFDRLEILSEDPTQTEAIAAVLGSFCLGGELLALRGGLGAGKTCFVRGLASGLGVEPTEIASPTFVLCAIHQGERLDLAHMDAWRIASPDELETIGFDELRARDDMVVAVEWPERLGAAIGTPTVLVELSQGAPVSGGSASSLRHIALSARAEFIAALRQRLARDPCRTCGRPTLVGAPTAPFCSGRCRLADLGAWFEGRHRILGGDDDPE